MAVYIATPLGVIAAAMGAIIYNQKRKTDLSVQRAELNRQDVLHNMHQMGMHRWPPDLGTPITGPNKIHNSDSRYTDAPTLLSCVKISQEAGQAESMNSMPDKVCDGDKVDVEYDHLHRVSSPAGTGEYDELAFGQRASYWEKNYTTLENNAGSYDSISKRRRTLHRHCPHREDTAYDKQSEDSDSVSETGEQSDADAGIGIDDTGCEQLQPRSFSPSGVLLLPVPQQTTISKRVRSMFGHPPSANTSQPVIPAMSPKLEEKFQQLSSEDDILDHTSTHLHSELQHVVEKEPSQSAQRSHPASDSTELAVSSSAVSCLSLQPISSPAIPELVVGSSVTVYEEMMEADMSSNSIYEYMQPSCSSPSILKPQLDFSDAPSTSDSLLSVSSARQPLPDEPVYAVAETLHVPSSWSDSGTDNLSAKTSETNLLT